MHHEYTPEGQTITELYYLKVLQRLRDAVRRKRPDLWQSQSFKLHHDNAPAHLSQLIVTYDFWLFPKISSN